MFRNLANGWRKGSLAAKLRQRRFALFLSLLDSVGHPVDILDIGGQEAFWNIAGLDHPLIRSVTLLNLWKEPVSHPKLKSEVGDARDLRQYDDHSVEVIFSNSVIEHVGGLREQQRMAKEIQRVARRYFVQTPNRHFPIEPHFLFPFFQYLPNRLRALSHNHFSLGWWKQQPNFYEALAEVESIRLLKKKEIQHLFPKAQIHSEIIWGLTKSFVAIGGWDQKKSL